MQFPQMNKNVGSMERKIRLGTGIAAVLAFPFIRSTWGRALLGTVATSGLATGFSRYCPINEAMGVNRFDSEAGDMLVENEGSSAMPMHGRKNMRGSSQMAQDSASLH